MFYCPECGYEFEKAVQVFESHGLTTPPFERVYRCPNCGGESFHEKTDTHCRCCGGKLPKDRKDYCTEACANKGKRLWAMELKRRKEEFSSPLNKIVREVTAYNQLNGTNYSYGQYVALIKPKKGKKKCIAKKRNS